MSELIVLSPQTDVFDLFHLRANQESLHFSTRSLGENEAYLTGLYDGLFSLCCTYDQREDLYVAYCSWVNSLNPLLDDIAKPPLVIECAA
ncbi:MAG: hypothetical protein GQ532_18455 [Methylomarinum sp.]|nr:hypothetical protein [Methylomarinum sp.]